MLQRKVGAKAVTLQHPLLAEDPRIVDAANGRVLKQGMSDAAVATTQKALEMVGHPPRGSKNPRGSFDGVWGGGTTSAVRAFQSEHKVYPVGGWEAGPKTFRALDAALLKGGGGGGGGGGGLELKKVEPFNPKLEAIFDQIMLEYTRLLKAQSRAVSDVELDLRDRIEKPSERLDIAILKHAAGIVFGKLYDKQLAESVRNVIKFYVSEATEFPEKYKGTGVDAPIDSILNAVKATVTGFPASPSAASLSGFVAMHQMALIDATLALQEDFIANRKPALREFHPLEMIRYAVTGHDPRLEEAQRLLESIRKSKETAAREQYQETTRAWVLANAQATLKQSGTKSVTFVADLHQHKGTHSVPGILELTFAYHQRKPKEPVTPVAASIAGLSKEVRAKINKADPTIGKLGYPVRATGGGGSKPLISVASDEERSGVANVDSSARGLKFLEDKDAGRWDEGIRRLVAELDPLKLSEVGGLKGPDG